MAVDTQPVAAPSRTRGPAVALRGVCVRLAEHVALRDIDCEIARGSFVGLLGPNGSGKTTLLRALLGILPLSSGSLSIDGRSPAEVRDLFGYLPQRRQLDMDLPLRAWDVVMMGRIRRRHWLRTPSRADKEAVARALETVGLARRRNSPMGELSFGQQQRVLFARMLAQEGTLLLLDEPMNGVDAATQDLFLELLAGYQEQGKTIVMATHDLHQAASVCNRLLLLNQTLIAYGPVADVLTEEVLLRAYGVHLHLPAGAERVSHVLDDLHHHHETASKAPDVRLV